MAREFSPITDETKLNRALVYVATSSRALARTVLGRELDIDTICFFTRTHEEYEFLATAIRKRGEVSKFAHGATLYVDTDFVVADQRIRVLGVREPDPTKDKIGYADYPFTPEEYMAVKESGNEYVHEIVSGRGQQLLQFEHPDFDVLGFGFREEEHA